jgi:prolyl 4-hydroxylase
MNAPIDNLERLQSKPRKYLLKDFKAREVNLDPYIVKINNLLSDEEIKELLKLAKSNFEKSNVMVDGELVYSKSRTSSTAYLFDDGIPGKYNEIIEGIIKRIRFLVNCERSQLEIMAVKYKKGEQFGNHVDYFNEDEVGVLDKGGNRISTFFVYLNTLPSDAGGETEFTKLGIKSKPKKGDAVFWYNKDFKTGKMLPITEHRGNPVLIDTVKYGLNVWVRSSSFY